MSDPVNVPFYISNNTGNTISTLWVNHYTNDDDYGIQSWMATSIANNGQSPTWSLQIVPRTMDYFAIFWTDSNNDLYGTPYEYSTEAFTDGAGVEAQIQSITNRITFLQVDKGEIGDTDYLKYISGAGPG